MNKIVFILLLLTAGCTDTRLASFSALGNSAHVVCYSGGIKIYDGVSTGVVHATTSSDGWEFKDRKTGHFVRVSGACVVESKP